MSDDLERLLRDVPGRTPRPDPEVTRRVRDQLLGARLIRRRRVSASVIAALLVGVAIGYWAIPQEEPAIGAADPPEIMIDAKPRAVSWASGADFEVFGALASRRAGERVVLEENVCGAGWTEASGTITTAGGRWSLTPMTGYFGPRANANLRARSRSDVSPVISVGVRPGIWLRKKTPNVYTADVSSGRSLRRRHAKLERYEKSTGRWLAVRRASLVDTSYGFETRATFRARLPRGTIIRAVVAASQARPCHLAGFSNMLTVG